MPVQFSRMITRKRERVEGVKRVASSEVVVVKRVVWEAKAWRAETAVGVEAWT